MEVHDLIQSHALSEVFRPYTPLEVSADAATSVV